MDAARCAKRLGAKEVYIIYRRSEEEMPARNEEIHHAKEEGIIFHFLVNPTEILGNDAGCVSGMMLLKMELGEPDDSGRRRPVPIEGSEFEIELDAAVIAIGQSPNPLLRKVTPALKTQSWGGIIADEENRRHIHPRCLCGRRRRVRRGNGHTRHGRRQRRRKSNARIHECQLTGGIIKA